MFRAIKRLFIWMGLMAEKATETDAINQAANDEANGSHYAEELATLEADLKDNQDQADSLDQLYKQNTEIIAESLREIQKFQREFEAVKAKVAIGRSLENLSGMMKSSITELQGMMGGEMGQSLQQLRQSAASGEGQMRATLDLAKEMGSGISRQQEARKIRGAALFQEYKKKMGMVQPEAAAAATPAPTAQPERQKIPEQ
jgi:predicted RNase H-like nuclease (RuvC/YqgF family)